MSTPNQRLRAERNFLLARLVDDHNGEWIGASSDAMVAQAMTGAREPRRWPLDNGDLARCEETYRRAPPHLQERMAPTLARFREAVAQRRVR